MFIIAKVSSLSSESSSPAFANERFTALLIAALPLELVLVSVIWGTLLTNGLAALSRGAYIEPSMPPPAGRLARNRARNITKRARTKSNSSQYSI